MLKLARREIAFAVAPSAWHEEVAAMLLKRLRAGRLAQGKFDDALRLFAELPIETHLNASPRRNTRRSSSQPPARVTIQPNRTVLKTRDFGRFPD